MHNKSEPLDQKKMRKLLDKADSLSSNASFWRRNGNTSKESLQADQTLQQFLSEHSDKECLQSVVDAREKYTICVEQDYERAVITDSFFEPDPCIDILRDLFKKKEECMTEHSSEENSKIFP